MRATKSLAWTSVSTCHDKITQRCITHIARRHFSRTVRQCNDFPNHYETLSIEPNATEKEIKKQFYTLSKQYHPDLHPNDPNASQRFVKISEAYAVLSSSEKRTLYDRDYTRAFRAPSSSSAPAYPSGSFSSAANPAGGRPASGLSRRRTKFQGPPPSFYKSGGWGEQTAKRAEHASRPSHSWEAQGESSVGAGQGVPGTGPGGFTHGFENDVPHFDSSGHYQTHSTIERTRHRARRRVQPEFDDVGGSGAILGFLTVSGVLGLALFFAGVFRPGVRTTSTEEKT